MAGSRGRCRLLVVLVALVVATASSTALAADGQVIYYTTNFIHLTDNFDQGLSVWVPEGVPLRGMLWVLPGRGGDSRSYLADPHWQQPARALGLGLIGLDNSSAYQYAEQYLEEFTSNFESALSGAAAATNHPEIENAPVAFWGFSWGGWNSNRYASAVPDRSLCYVNDKYSYTTNLLVPSAARVPGLFISGENDTNYGVTTIRWFNTWRGTHGADVALIADWDKGHSWTAPDLAWTHIAQAMKERYPQGQPTATAGVTLATVPNSTAWLGQSNRVSDDVLTPVGWPEIAEYSDYSGDVSKASWLINKTEALVYRAHNATNPRVVNIGPTVSDGFFLEEYQLGQEIGLQLSFSSDPDTISLVQVYHDDELIVDSGTVLDAGQATFNYLPSGNGIHTFTTVVTYLVDGQPMYASDYWAAVVVPEPATMGMLCGGWLTAILLRKRQGLVLPKV